jgi:hypothetical protein
LQEQAKIQNALDLLGNPSFFESVRTPQIRKPDAMKILKPTKSNTDPQNQPLASQLSTGKVDSILVPSDTKEACSNGLASQAPFEFASQDRLLPKSQEAEAHKNMACS